MDPDDFTGYVTFVSSRLADAPALGGVADQPGIEIALSSEDCAKPLPD
jgi:hypothetical protein